MSTRMTLGVTCADHELAARRGGRGGLSDVTDEHECLQVSAVWPSSGTVPRCDREPRGEPSALHVSPWALRPWAYTLESTHSCVRLGMSHDRCRCPPHSASAGPLRGIAGHSWRRHASLEEPVRLSKVGRAPLAGRHGTCRSPGHPQGRPPTRRALHVKESGSRSTFERPFPGKPGGPSPRCHRAGARATGLPRRRGGEREAALSRTGFPEIPEDLSRAAGKGARCER